MSEENEMAHNLQEGLALLQRSQKFCDIILKSGEYSIHAHKAVLWASSAYFRGMFSGQFKERDSVTINLDNLDGKYLQTIIQYIYTGKLDVTMENVQDILLVANFLQIASAEKICSDFLIKNIDSENCFGMLDLARKLSMAPILNVSIRCVMNNIYQSSSQVELLELDVEEVEMLLSNNEWYKYSEDTKLVVINKWIGADTENRNKHLPKLLNNVKLNLVTRELLERCTFSKNEKCTKFLETKNNNSSNKYSCVIFNRLGSDNIQIHHSSRELSVDLLVVPEKLCNSTFSSFGNTIFMQGGWVSRRGYTTSSYAFSLECKHWSPFVPLTVARSNLRSCCLNAFLYTAGGSRGLTHLSIVERLDLTTGQYIECPDMNKSRSSFGMVAYDNCIYVMGGHNDLEFISTIERFDPREGTWKTLPKTSYSRADCSGAVFEDNIYCSFGPGNALERFDVRNDQWIIIEPPAFGHAREIFTENGKLYGFFETELCSYSSMEGKWEFENVLFLQSKYLTAVPVLLF